MGNVLTETLTGASVPRSSSYQYNNLGQPTYKENKVNNIIVNKQNNTYNSSGNLVNKTEYKGTESSVQDYAYDGMGRVVNESGAGYANSYTYDKFGNRDTMLKTLADGSVATKYGYDGNNRLTKTTETDTRIPGTENITEYGYDNNGSMMSRLNSVIHDKGSVK